MQSIFIAPQLYAVCVPQVGVFVSEFKEKQLGKFDEVNDHECMMAFNGDRDAIEIIIDNWGADVAKGIKRLNAYLTVEQVANGEWL